MTNTPIIDRITSLIAPIVADLKLDLYDLEYNGGLLKITVDTPVGAAGGVTLDQLSLVTRLVGRDLDHHDPIPGHYTLEVTSPGLERTLRTPTHFRREVGKTVAIRLRSSAVHGVNGGDRRVHGVLVTADDHVATIRVDAAGDSVERVVPYGAIDRARTVFVWAGADKPSGKGAKSNTTNKSVAKGDTATRPSAVAAAGRIKPAPGPHDELDPPTFEEATA